MKIIDPHVHLFDLQLGHYHWLKPDHPPCWDDKSVIYQSFDQHNLQLAQPHTLAGFVHIEAGFNNEFPWHEITWLEKNVTLPFSSIAYLDITKSTTEFEHDFQQLCQHKSVVGCRYILDEQAGKLLTSPQVIRNLERIADKSWLFELHIDAKDATTIHHVCQLSGESHLPDMVINHAGFPPNIDNTQQWQLWHQHIKQLAQFDHLYIKASGWEMTNREYDWAWVESSLHLLLDEFGDDRVMLASNFPLTLFSHPYSQYWHSLINDIALKPETLTKLCFTNANKLYRLKL